MEKVFTAEDAWYGGFHELAIELGLRSDERVLAALNTVWSLDRIDGCFTDRGIEPSEQTKIAPSLDMTGTYHGLGVAMLPNGKECACGTCVIREDGGTDWFIFYLPTGSLSYAYRIGGYPFSTEAMTRPWQEPVNEWLVTIGRAIFDVAPFEMALIGHEVSGSETASRLREQGLPKKRYIGYLCREGTELAWYPPTHY